MRNHGVELYTKPEQKLIQVQGLEELLSFVVLLQSQVKAVARASMATRARVRW